MFDDDVSFVHSSNRSFGDSTDDCFEKFEQSTSGILIATSALVSEGLDVPSIDSVYVTYQSQSISHLLQTAGRALRYSEGKSSAAIIQVKSNDLEYYFNSEWLYQDTDRLRPRIQTLVYSNKEHLQKLVREVLANKNIAADRLEELLAKVDEIETGQNARIF